MLGFIVTLLVVLTLYYGTVKPFRLHQAAGVSFDKSLGPVARSTFKYVAALGLIVSVESCLPSMTLTGRYVPAHYEAPRYIDEAKWTDANLTYEDMSQLAPWLWPLGTISQDALITRLERDLDLLAPTPNAKRPKLSVTTSQGVTVRAINYVTTSKQRNAELLASGLASALEEVRGKPSTAPIAAADADKLVASHIKRVLDARQEAGNAHVKDLTAKIVAIELASGDAEITDPAHAPLVIERNAANRSLRSLGMQNLQLIVPLGALASARQAADQAFPNFGGPILVSSQTATSSPKGKVDALPIAAAPFRDTGQAISDAITGYRRAPDRHYIQQRCGFAVMDANAAPALRQMCDVTLPLNINYDLTGMTCSATLAPEASTSDLARKGTRISKDACKESWIYPQITVSFEQGSFTVHTPLPIGPDGLPFAPAPLSLWHATWNGIEKPLRPSARFKWDGKTDVIEALSLRHDVQPQVIHARRWTEYRGTPTDFISSMTVLGAALASRGNMPVTLEGLSLGNVVPLARPFTTLGATDGTAPNGTDAQIKALGRALAEQQTVLNRVGASVRYQSLLTGKGSPTPCRVFALQTMLGTHPDAEQQNLEVGRTMRDRTCDTVLAYGSLLNAAQRALTDGSWLWITELDVSLSR